MINKGKRAEKLMAAVIPFVLAASLLGACASNDAASHDGSSSGTPTGSQQPARDNTQADAGEETEMSTEASEQPEAADAQPEANEQPEAADDQTEASEQPEAAGEQHEATDVQLSMSINGTLVAVEWEDNESVDSLCELAKDGPIAIRTSPYGGFEQVGALGVTLPSNDEQTTTAAGDIVLYSGNQIVVFYGSNSWAYTRLGRIMDKSEAELAELLSGEDVEITLELGS